MVVKEAGDGENADWTNLYDLEGPQSIPVSPPNYSKNFPTKEEGGKAEGKELSVENRDGPKLLPFEFVALEACLEAACSCLDNEVLNSYATFFCSQSSISHNFCSYSSFVFSLISS